MLYRYIKYPLTDKNDVPVVFTPANIIQDIVSSNVNLWFRTRKGSVFYNSGYGSFLEKFLFSQNDNVSIEEIQNYIREELPKAYPNITVRNFIVQDTQDGKSAIMKIEYEYREDNFSFSNQIDIEITE